MDKKVLDVCCGPRGMWFNKHDERCLYLDMRSKDYKIEPNAAYPNGTILKIKPDEVGDFTDIKQPDNSFHLVVFDPPHITQKKPTALITKQYGNLSGDWKTMLKNGFSECFRVLKPNGVLIFKWNECRIPIKEILALTDEKPLFGHKSGKLMQTHWVSFIK